MKKTLLIVIACIASAFSAVAQDIVVSDYYNVGGNPPVGEWIELLVIKDSLNLAGYMVRDNAGTSKQWQGGVRFKNVPMWQHLRAGTIIVIKSRGTEAVINKARAGYIEIGAENPIFFEKVVFCPNCTVADWDQTLSINADYDIIQILKYDSTHVHALGHIPFPNDDVWNSVPTPKAAFNNTIDNGSSVCVAPGRSLAAYNSGVNPDSVYKLMPVETETMGLPNNRPGFDNINQLFWRALRQPLWLNRTLTAKRTNNNVVLNWSTATDIYPQDSLQGYLILRILSSQIGLAKNPTDGLAYAPGARIGPATVVANIPYSQTSTYTDNFVVPCGQTYYYRIYAYRFDGDDGFPLEKDSIKARGRAYNELFAQDSATRIAPEITSFTVEPSSRVCAGDSVTLVVNVGKSTYRTIEWYKNGAVFKTDTSRTLVVKESGTYRAIVTNQFDCSELSDEITVTVLPAPIAQTFIGSKQITSDTVFALCPGQTVKLEPLGGQVIRWFRNNVEIQSGTVMAGSITLSLPGKYYAIHSNDICFDTSYHFTVSIRNVRTDLAVDTIDLQFDASENNKTATSTITNLDTLDMPIISLAYGAKIATTRNYNGAIVAAGASKNIDFVYSGPRAGTYMDSIVYHLPCGDSIVQYIRVTKISSGLSADPNPISIANLLTCNALKDSVKVQIINSNTVQANLVSATLPAGMLISPDPAGVSIAPGGNSTFYLHFTDATPRVISDNVTFVYNFGGANSNLDVTLNINIIEPSFSVSPTLTELLLLPCETQKDTVLNISNSSSVEITISKQSTDPYISFLNLPLTIPAGGISELRVRATTPDNQLHIIDLVIEADECAATAPTQIKISKDGLNVQYSTDSLSFPENVMCSADQATGQETINLHLDYNPSTITPQVASVTVTGPFSTDFGVGTVLGADNDIKINYLVTAPGVYEGMLNITLTPCDIQKSIPLRVRVSDGQPVFSTTVIDFPNVTVGATEVKSFTISNPTGQPMVISNNTGFTPDITLIEPTTFPVTINPDSSVEFKVQYFQSDAEDKSTTATFNFASPCPSAEMITIKGTSGTIPTINYTLFIPDTTVEVNDTLKLPVYLQTNNIAEMISASPSLLKFSVAYNPSILSFARATVGSALDAARVQSITLTNDAPGSSTVELRLDSKAIVSANPLVWLVSPTYLGNDTTSMISFTAHEMSQSPNYQYNSSLRNGRLILTGPCAYSLRVVDYVNPNTVSAEKQMVSDVISCKLTSNGLDHARLELFDNNGTRILKVADALLPAGEYTYSLPTSGISSGVYYLALYSAHKVTTIPIRIVK